MNLDQYIEEFTNYQLSNKNLNYKILNEFEEIHDQYNDIFSIIIYYLETNLFKIIVRRLDNDSGWGKDLKINLFSVDKINKQTISIGSNDRNTKILEINTNIILEKNNNTNIILKKYNINNYPIKTIIQAKSNNSFDNHRQYLNFTDLIYNNNNIDYLFFNNTEQRKFIKNNFAQYLDNYDLLYDCNVKYIIFICCYIYLNGGVFIHPDILLTTHIEKINTENSYSIDQNNEIIFLDSEKNNNEIIKYLNYLLDIKFNNINKISDKYIFNNLIEFNDFKNFKNYLSNQDNFKNIQIFKINKYKFIIESDTKYIITYLDENYYLLKPLNKYNIIENDFFIKYIDEDGDNISKIIVKTDSNNYKTNNVFFFNITN
jgi:hypothetical protein